ncbi:PorT family protein [Hymenobacter tibetensis]|uniref:PorT family protein n=1 Tax=Hymenobacter tibetensis TaxID=497967 RepID=A0ABY4CWC5_9BACT|nr:porin family protein [Hymenobacter tibetensis]UOG74555.1 PorT family protein [Hymenobacter tibetensis]
MIRHFTLSLLGLLAATNTLQAQHLRFGVKAGLNASTYYGGDVANPRFRLGPMAGVLARLPLFTHLDVQPELLFEQRGARTSYTKEYRGTDTNVKYTYQERSLLHYIGLPVLGRVHGEKWFAVAGPQLSYLVGARRRGHSRAELASGVPDPAFVFPEATSVRGTNDYQRWEVGYVVGIGYQATTRFGVELRYAAGLTSVRQPLDYATTIPTSRTEGIRNRTLQAQVSYQLSAL